MLSVLLAASLQAATVAPALDCAQPQSASYAITAAGAALNKRDYTGAASTIAPLVAACGPKTQPGSMGRVMAAEAAVGLSDWKAALDDLKDLDVARTPRLYAYTEFQRLAAYAGLKDEVAFAATRSRLMAAENAAIARLGPAIERFDVGPYHVTAYKAAISQGGFARKMEFVVEPTAPLEPPMSIMLTDDLMAGSIAGQLGLKGPTSKIWFVDLYTCQMHATLPPPPPGRGDAVPAYEDVKPIVIKALTGKTQSWTPGICFTRQWVTPGLIH